MSQLFRKQIEDDRGAANERDVRKNRNATEAAGVCDAAQDRATVHDRGHVRHNQYRQAETPAGDPEVGFGFLVARGDQAKRNDGDEVQAKNNGTDGSCAQENILMRRSRPRNVSTHFPRSFHDCGRPGKRLVF